MALGDRLGGRYTSRMPNNQPKPACGPHSELVRTDSVRITRCSCGTVHVHLLRNGTTVQIAPEYFAEIAQAMSLARTVMQGSSAPEAVLQPSSPVGGFVTLPIFASAKKSSN
jgi:hypothetical protein